MCDFQDNRGPSYFWVLQSSTWRLELILTQIGSAKYAAQGLSATKVQIDDHFVSGSESPGLKTRNRYALYIFTRIQEIMCFMTNWSLEIFLIPSKKFLRNLRKDGAWSLYRIPAPGRFRSLWLLSTHYWERHNSKI